MKKANDSLFLNNYKDIKKQTSAKRVNIQRASAIWKGCASLFFILYVGLTLLHRFVMPQNIVALDNIETGQDNFTSENVQSYADAAENDGAGTAQEQTAAQPVITSTSYTDENIQITIDTIREFETDIYIAEIIVSDPSYLKTGLAENSFGTNVKEKTSVIAEENNAILAINGDYYGFRDYGYVMRNGYLYRDVQEDGGNEDLVIYGDGSMEIIQENDISAQELEQQGAVQIFSFGPGLISGGEIIVDESSKVEREDESNPRTAIAMIDENHYIFMVADGRTSQSEGLSIEEMAIVLSAYGCEVAYNLDGGGSATMVFMGEIVNYPTTNGRDFNERSVSDIVYIGQ